MTTQERFGRAPWTAAKGFEIHGTKFGIRLDRSADDPFGFVPGEAREIDYSETDHRLSLVTNGAELPNGLYFDSRGFEEIFRFNELDEGSLKGLETKLQFVLALVSAPNLFYIHAGAVEVNGAAVLIVGNTHSGKTTLVRELVARGAGYLTDDCAVLDRIGRVLPWTAPLAVRGTGGRQFFTAEELGGRSVNDAVPLATVLLTRFQAGTEWVPAAVPPGQAALELLGNCFYRTVVAEFPREALEFAGTLHRAADFFSGDRGEAGPVCDWIFERHLTQVTE